METKIKVLTKAEVKKALENAKCPAGLIERIGQDISLWWKTGWIQEILLAQKIATIREVRELALQSIADEPEYPTDMPDELWNELNGNRENTDSAMKSTVRLTKNGITERLLARLKKIRTS